MAGIKLSEQSKVLNNGKERKSSSNFTNVLSKDINFGKRQLSDLKKERLYSEMSVLLNAKVDIHSALQIIAEQYEQTKFGEVFSNICRNVIKGSTLSSAIKESGCFSEYESKSIFIGEETGRLEEVLLQLSSYYAGRVKQKRQIISVISYPLIVLLTALAAVFFMLRFVVPMFADVFKRFNSELPAMTKAILLLSEYIGRLWLPVVLLTLSIVVFLYMSRNKDWFRNYSSSLILKIPTIKVIVRSVYLSRFSQSMSLLLSSKVPLDNALTMVMKMIEFYPMEVSLKKVKEDVLSGESLHSSLAKFPLYDKKFTSLIRVAEEVNQMDIIFQKLSVQYNEDAQHRISVLNNLLEPLIIIGLGLFVTIILIAMYLPLFRLSNSFGL